MSRREWTSGKLQTRHLFFLRGLMATTHRRHSELLSLTGHWREEGGAKSRGRTECTRTDFVGRGARPAPPFPREARKACRVRGPLWTQSEADPAERDLGAGPSSRAPGGECLVKENSMFLVEALGSCPRPQAPPPGLGPRPQAYAPPPGWGPAPRARPRLQDSAPPPGLRPAPCPSGVKKTYLWGTVTSSVAPAPGWESIT